MSSKRQSRFARTSTGGHKYMIDELDRDKYQRLVELGWLKAFVTNISEVSYRVTERGRAAASGSGIFKTAKSHST